MFNDDEAFEVWRVLHLVSVTGSKLVTWSKLVIGCLSFSFFEKLYDFSNRLVMRTGPLSGFP